MALKVMVEYRKTQTKPQVSSHPSVSTLVVVDYPQLHFLRDLALVGCKVMLVLDIYGVWYKRKALRDGFNASLFLKLAAMSDLT